MFRIKSIASNVLYPIAPFSEERPFKEYEVELDTQHYSVYTPRNEKIVAAHDNVVCTQLVHNNDVLFLYPNIQTPNRRRRIRFNATTFPGLIADSSIHIVLLIPYISKNGNRDKQWRLVVITDKCQVYHNFPDTCKNKKEAIFTFSESMIWDLPGNRYPSLNPQCESYEYHFPFLPDDSYEYYPGGNTPRVYHVKHKDGREENLARFYFPNRSLHSNPFFYLNGYEPDPIMTFIGSYSSNYTSPTASRIVVFATSDGGVNWFAKYEFNDNGTAENYGTNLCLHPSVKKAETDFDVDYICKRDLVPSVEDALELRCGECFKVKQIIQKETMEVVFEKEHSLQSGNIVALKGEGKTCISRSILNNSFSDNDYGNGIFYKVKVIDNQTVQLFECVSKSKTNLPARHIHSINRVKDGFLVATGETYPQGWIMMFSITDADSWSNNHAWDDIPVIRLNTSRESVQRIVGAILLDNKEHELIYASDCSSMNIDEIEVVDGVPTNSIGIYKGKLTDIDDFRKFELLEEVKEPSFFFKELDGCYVFCGQRGELAVGLDHGKYWRHARLATALARYMGRTLNYFIIDGKILRIK